MPPRLMVIYIILFHLMDNANLHPLAFFWIEKAMRINIKPFKAKDKRTIKKHDHSINLFIEIIIVDSDTIALHIFGSEPHHFCGDSCV